MKKINRKFDEVLSQFITEEVYENTESVCDNSQVTPEIDTFTESFEFTKAYNLLLDSVKSKKKKKVSKLRSRCQSKAKSKYSVWPSAYASGYVQKCVNRGGKIK